MGQFTDKIAMFCYRSLIYNRVVMWVGYHKTVSIVFNLTLSFTRA